MLTERHRFFPTGVHSRQYQHEGNDMTIVCVGFGVRACSVRV